MDPFGFEKLMEGMSESMDKNQEMKSKSAAITISFSMKGHQIVVSGYNPEIVFSTIEKLKEEIPKKLETIKGAK